MNDEIALRLLDDLGERLKQACKDLEAVVFGARDAAIAQAITVGQILLDAKEAIPHGGWNAWVKVNFQWSTRKATDCMKLASNSKSLKLLDQHRDAAFPISTIQEALKAIPKSPEETVRDAGKKSGKKGAVTVRSTSTEGSPAAAGTATPPIEDPPALLDMTKRTVRPEAKQFARIQEAMGRASEFTQRMTTISKLKTEVSKLAKEDPVWGHVTVSAFQLECENVRRHIRFARPYAVCPYCDGEGCKSCYKQGWVTELVWKSAPPEMRERS